MHRTIIFDIYVLWLDRRLIIKHRIYISYSVASKVPRYLVMGGYQMGIKEKFLLSIVLINTPLRSRYLPTAYRLSLLVPAYDTK